MNSTFDDNNIRQQRKVRVAYRCSYCGCVISSDVTKQTLKNAYRLPCIECGKSTLEIYPASDGKIKLVVPCLMCPHPHPFTISSQMFFERDIYTFPCSFTGLDICFIGNEDEVEDEIDASGALIREMTDDNSFGEDGTQRKNAGMMVADTSVMREVLFAIGNLEEQKKITCSCGSRAVKVLIDYDKAKITCKVCAKSIDIPARTRFDANNAIDLEEIFIS